MNKKKSDFYYLLSLVGQIGWTISLPLVIFIGLGFLADQQLNTKPRFILMGLFLGMLVSFYSLYQLVKKLLKLNQSKN